MGKALSGELSCTRTGLVFSTVTPVCDWLFRSIESRMWLRLRQGNFRLAFKLHVFDLMQGLLGG